MPIDAAVCVSGDAISLFAMWLAERPKTSSLSFGFHRAEILGAVASVLMIWALTGTRFPRNVRVNRSLTCFRKVCSCMRPFCASSTPASTFTATG